MKDARHVLESLYAKADFSIPANESRPGEKRHPARSKTVDTLFGPIILRRDYLYNETSGEGRAPLDEALGLIHGTSPALVRLSSRAAARMGYENASEDLAALANIRIDGRQIQRLVGLVAPKICVQCEQVKTVKDASENPIPVMYVEVDGTGVPMVSDELEGRAGKQPDGSAKTREVKLGAVFTQIDCDEQGRPEREYQSTTYVGSFETAAEFGARIRAEAFRRGLGRTVQTVFLGDGAAWVWELARVNFPGAVQILDLFHALERLGPLCDGLYGAGTSLSESRQEEWAKMFKQDKVREVITVARTRLQELITLSEPQREALTRQIAYFENHQDRMLYLTYRNQGFFYGSGVIEAGCKTVVGQRLKQSGMFWSESGAQNVLVLRCALMSHLWDLCWDRLHSSGYLTARAAA